MKKISLLVYLVTSVLFGQTDEKIQISRQLDAWHTAAGTADFDSYFGLMTNDAVFIGTDADENWSRAEFIAYAKPHFDEGKAWSFTSVQRNIYISENNDVAWFDELLDTQMKLCRGSGVLKKENGNWKIAHYVLSIAVPNADVDALIKLKAEKDNLVLKRLRSNKKAD